MKEFLVSLVLGLLFSLAISSGIAAEDNLIEQQCSGLSGYEYGVCQASIQ